MTDLNRSCGISPGWGGGGGRWRRGDSHAKVWGCSSEHLSLTPLGDQSGCGLITQSLKITILKWTDK